MPKDIPLLPPGPLSGEEREKLSKLQSEGGPGWIGWETGHRGWKAMLKKGREPRLGSLGRVGTWEPGEEGEVISDVSEEEKEKFEETSAGLYSLRSLKEVLDTYGGQSDIVGSIIPYGKTFHGESGFRSEKAKVRALFRSIPKCYVCGKVAKYYLYNKGVFALCERDLGRLDKIIRAQGWEYVDIDTILNKLAEIYGAEVVDMPEEGR